jgi:ABC-type nitrate/sulfonate/bicarbonate transport system permease component
MKGRSLIITTIIFFLIWQLASIILQRSILPTPLEVGSALIFELFQGELIIHSIASIGRIFAGLGISVVLASSTGLALGQSKKINDLFSPAIYLLYPIPKVVFVPIIMLLFGIGDLSKIIIIFIILFFQILVLVRDQATNIHPELINSVRSLGAGRRALYKFVYFPATWPAILTAIRQSVGTAIAVLYIAELFATQKGLGYYIYFQGSTLLNYPAMYAGVIMMSLIGLGLYFGVDWLERKTCKWIFAT